MAPPAGHAYKDDGSGTKTCTCGLPFANRRHIAAPVPRQVSLPRVGLHHPETSYAAAQARMPREGTIRSLLLRTIADRPNGATDDELEQITGGSHQSVSSSRNALMNDGLIVPLHDNGTVVTRPTRTASDATVWVLSALARAQQHWSVSA